MWNVNRLFSEIKYIVCVSLSILDVKQRKVLGTRMKFSLFWVSSTFVFCFRAFSIIALRLITVVINLGFESLSFRQLVSWYCFFFVSLCLPLRSLPPIKHPTSHKTTFFFSLSAIHPNSAVLVARRSDQMVTLIKLFFVCFDSRVSSVTPSKKNVHDSDG